MPINKQSKYEVVSTSPSYMDLRHIADDKTVLENPHKGWYYHLVDNSLTKPKYREGLVADKRFKTPCMNHMYLRFDWGDIEKEKEGVLDWSEIDSIMNDWGALGYKFSLRICTYEGGSVTYATPKWLIDMGIKSTAIEGTRADGTSYIAYEPDYSDEVYLEKLDSFLKKCAERFDSDPRVEFIDIGTYGTWGEGHTFGGTNIAYGIDVLMKHINLHLKHFKNKRLVLNDDFIESAWKCGPDEASMLYDYCLGKGLGLRDDSICVDGYVKLFGYDTLRRPSIFPHFAENAPVDIEFAHIFHNTAERFKEGFPIIEALRNAHATYAGFHGYEDEWRKKTEYLSDYVANRLGYWFFIDGVDVGTPSSGATEITKIHITNRGYSKCYNQYDLKIRVTDSEGNSYPLNSSYPDSTRWARECTSIETLRLDYRAVPVGNYHFELGLFEGDLPIKLGIKSEYKLDDGYYRLFPLEVKPL